VAKARFRIISSIPAEDEREEALKEYHSYWRKTNTNTNAPFVPIFNAFFKDDILATIEPGALRLYLYFAFAANNTYGNSWHSIETIAKYFKTRTRTVNNWIKILVDKNLIYREPKGKRSHTYLIPYSNTVIKHNLRRDFKEDNQTVLDTFIKKIRGHAVLYGSIVEVFHFFQWKTDDKNKPTKEGLHWLFVITMRPDGVLVGHNYSLKNSSHLGVNQLTIEDSDIATFVSPFKHEEHNVRGLVLTHKIKLINSNTGTLLQLMEDLAKAEIWDWDEHPKFEYGKIAELLPEEEEAEQEEVPDEKQKGEVTQ